MIDSRQPTRYEIALNHTDGRAYLVSYAERRSLRGLIAAVSARAESIRKVSGLPPTALFNFGTKPRAFAKHGEWTIAFTGRTEREIKNSGGREQALDYIGSVKS